MASASLLVVATAFFTDDESVNRKLRNHWPRPGAVHHQLHAPSKTLEIGTDLRSANHGY